MIRRFIIIKIENMKTYNGFGIQVGRLTALGNPFIIGKHGNRVECIRKYRIWLWKQICGRNKAVLIELEHIKRVALIGDVVLLCWCKPKACHASIIKACIEWSIRYSSYGLIHRFI